jgi:hypothetical protein
MAKISAAEAIQIADKICKEYNVLRHKDRLAAELSDMDISYKQQIIYALHALGQTRFALILLTPEIFYYLKLAGKNALCFTEAILKIYYAKANKCLTIMIIDLLVKSGKYAQDVASGILELWGASSSYGYNYNMVTTKNIIKLIETGDYVYEAVEAFKSIVDYIKNKQCMFDRITTYFYNCRIAAEEEARKAKYVVKLSPELNKLLELADIILPSSPEVATSVKLAI